MIIEKSGGDICNGKTELENEYGMSDNFMKMKENKNSLTK